VLAFPRDAAYDGEEFLSFRSSIRRAVLVHRSWTRAPRLAAFKRCRAIV
jgi:hypothetical protein